MLLPHVGAPQLLPRSLLETVEKPQMEPIDHYLQWVDACLGKGKCSTGFEYAAPLTIGVLLGVVGNRFPGKKLNWDAKKVRFKKNEKANKLVGRHHRSDY